MKAGFLDALRLAAAGQAPTPGSSPVPGNPEGLHEQLLASIAAREGAGTVPTVTPGRPAPAGRPRPPFTPVSSRLDAEGDSLGARARRARTVPRGRGPGTIEQALGEDPANPEAPPLVADVVPGAGRDLRGGDGEPAEVPNPAMVVALAAFGIDYATCHAAGHDLYFEPHALGGGTGFQAGCRTCKVGGGVAEPADPVEAALAKEVEQPLPLDGVARWPDGHPGFKVCPVCDGAGQLQAGSKGLVPCGRCGGEGEVPNVDLAKPFGRVVVPAKGPTPTEALKALLQEGIDAVNADTSVDKALFEGARYSQCPEHPEFQPWCLECAAAWGAEPVDPGWPAEQVYAYVNQFEESQLGPIRFPGSIAESNQGPDPRYQPWMDACLPLAAADANCPDVVVEGMALAPPTLTYDLPTDLYALPVYCYVAGPAGTGKTFQAKAWAASDPEGVVLAATTGIAAVNLGEGCTINSLFKYYDTNSLMEAFTGGWLEAQVVKLRKAGLRRVVLDEVSMLDGDQLTILSRAFDNVNQGRGQDDPEVGLVLVGDFAQLPPVRASYAFESAEWARYAQATYRLTTIRRQADLAFIEALQAVRRGDHEAALGFFRERLESTTHPTFDGTTILAKNEAVDKYNQLRLDKVPGQPLAFPSTRWGKLRPEWGGKPKPPQEWGVPEVLKLKDGALVMILANRNIAEKGQAPEYLYVNGDLGVIEGTSGSTFSCNVRLQRTGQVVGVEMITRENTIPLEPGRRKALKEEGHPERISANGKNEVIGAVSYMPLRLAWGTTVHKSQGLSLDTVQVNMRDPFFASPSMLYVALSRARTAEGLRLVGTPEGFRARCKVAEKVRGWL